MTWALAHRKPLSIALGLVLAFVGGYAYRGEPPAPAVHAVEDTASQKASTTQTATVDQKGPETITRRTYRTAPGKPPEIASETVVQRGPEVTTTHAAEQSTEAQQTHLDLTVTPAPEKPEWAVAAGVSLPGKELRLELDRRLFGNLWVSGAVVPARREVGVGLRMEW